MKRYGLLLLLIGLQACTTPSILMPSATDSQLRLNPAVVDLLDRAQQSMRQNQLSQASELIERAARISPRSPFPYEALARLRYQESKYKEVSALVRKATQLARSLPESREKVALMGSLNSLSERIRLESQ